jgi:hypothetical protein
VKSGHCARSPTASEHNNNPQSMNLMDFTFYCYLLRKNTFFLGAAAFLPKNDNNDFGRNAVKAIIIFGRNAEAPVTFLANYLL